MFTENELWKIVSLVAGVDYYSESNFEFGLKVLDMLPDSKDKTHYQKIFNQELIDLQEYKTRCG
jgi:hypothetical protein